MEEEIYDTSPGGWLEPERVANRHALFKMYVEPYLNLVFKLCINYSYSRHHVEENYNEVLANFYRHIETYDPSKSILTWLHIVTKRHVVELEKRRKRMEDADDMVRIADYQMYDFYEEIGRAHV